MQTSAMQAARKALSDIFHTNFKSLEDDLERDRYVFIKHMLANMDHKEALHGLLDQSIES